jgi:hypothetical protein
MVHHAIGVAFRRNANTWGYALRRDLCDSWDLWVSHISLMSPIGPIRWRSPTCPRHADTPSDWVWTIVG